MGTQLQFTQTFSDYVCAFSHAGVGWSRATLVNFDGDFNSTTPTLTLTVLRIQTGSLLEADLPADFPMTVELKIGNSTTGQIALKRSKIDLAYGNYRIAYGLDSSLSNPSIAIPQNNDNDVSVQIIIRADNTVKSTNTFLIPPPLHLSVSSISPSPATGKVCTVTLNRSIPGPYPDSSPWLIMDSVLISTYHDDTVYRLGSYAYGTDMATKLTSRSYGFNAFTFYIPYDSSKTKTDDQAKIKMILDAGVGGSRYSAFMNQVIRYTFEHIFTMSYVDQTDPLANPTVTLNAIAENPTGMLARYGKYVGGGIGKLTFSLASAVCKFGASFSKRTVYLYNSNGTLNNSWEYSNLNNFTLSLTNKNDSAWYIVVAITDSAGRTGSATTAVFQAYGYATPEIQTFSASRCNQDGTANDNGEYCKITFHFTVTPLNDVNTKSVTVVAPDGSHVWTDLDYDHSSNYQYISTADPEHSYVITLTVVDDFKTVSRSMNLSTAGVIMDFLAGGDGIGLGKVAELADTVDINPNWTLRINNIDLVQWMQDIEDRLTAGNL